MGQLVGLPDTSRNIDALFIDKGSDIVVILNNEYAATSAGEYGALNIWKDDNDCIRGEVYRNFNSLDAQKFDSFPQAIKWANKWLKKIK